MARRARRTPFVVILLTVLGFGLIGLILISTAMQTQTFELSRLTNQARDLEIQQQALERTVNDLASPRSLGPRATQLGMVPNETPVYLELADGSVRGKPTPAERQPGFAKAIR